MLEQPRLQVRVDRRPAEQRVQERRRLLLGERREQDRRRVDLAAAPAGSPRQQLGARRAEDEERDAARPVDEVVDEVEQRVVGPVQVLEDEDERPLVGDRLQEAAPGGERLVAAVARRLVALEAGERTQVPLDPGGVGRVADESLDGLAKLLLGLARAVGLEDARLRLDHLAERPERHALAVRKRAAVAPVDEPVVAGLDRLEELEDEPALADPGTPTSVTSCGSRSRIDAGERLAQERELLLAADERRAADPLDARRAHAP